MFLRESTTVVYRFNGYCGWGDWGTETYIELFLRIFGTSKEFLGVFLDFFV